MQIKHTMDQPFLNKPSSDLSQNVEPKNELHGALDGIDLFNKFHFNESLRRLVDRPKKKLEDMTPEEEAYEIFDSYFSNPLGPLDKDPDAITAKEDKLAAKKNRSHQGDRSHQPISIKPWAKTL